MRLNSLNIKYINVVLFTTIVEIMTTIFKPGINLILNIFYSNKNLPIHLRELSRLTNLEGQGIVRYLNELEKENILVSKKEANLKKYNLKNNDKVYSLLSLFDINRYNKLPLIKRKTIEHYLNSLEKQPIVLLLFGSTAKGNFKENSDLDLLLIVNEKINTLNAKKFTSSQTAQIINDFQINCSDFLNELKLKNDYVVQSAIETGYPLTNHLTYYRWLRNE